MIRVDFSMQLVQAPIGMNIRESTGNINVDSFGVASATVDLTETPTVLDTNELTEPGFGFFKNTGTAGVDSTVIVGVVSGTGEGAEVDYFLELDPGQWSWLKLASLSLAAASDGGTGPNAKLYYNIFEK